jgi:hypothetical protein
VRADDLLFSLIPRPHQADWKGPISRPSRPWDSVILPEGVKESLLKDVKDFISEEETAWYVSKGECMYLLTTSTHRLSMQVSHIDEGDLTSYKTS